MLHDKRIIVVVAMLQLRLWFFLLWLSSVGAIASGRGRSGMCFSRGNPLEPKCNAIFTTRSAAVDNLCFINNDQVSIDDSVFPTWKRSFTNLLSDNTVLQRRGISSWNSVSFTSKLSCRQGFVLVGSQCYSNEINQYSFDEAKQKARELGSDITLPSFHSDEDTKDLLFFISVVQQRDLNSFGSVWTGSFYESNKWQNLDGTEADYFRWNPAAAYKANAAVKNAMLVQPQRYLLGSGSYLGYFTPEPVNNRHTTVFVAPPDHENKPVREGTVCDRSNPNCFSSDKLSCLTIPLYQTCAAKTESYYFDTDLMVITQFAQDNQARLSLEVRTNTAPVRSLPWILPPETDDYLKQTGKMLIQECPTIMSLFSTEMQTYASNRKYTQLMARTPGTSVYNAKNLGYCTQKQGECGATVPLYSTNCRTLTLHPSSEFFYYSVNATRMDIAASKLCGPKQVMCYSWTGVI